MKLLLKKILFGSGKQTKILSGVSSGMITNYNPKDRGLHLLGLYEREIHSFITKGISRAHTLIDIGANDGYYALAFSKNKKKKIILCEPGEQELADLRMNLSLNGLKISDELMIVDKFISNNASENTVSVNSLFVDDSPSFVLMDVDGAEQEILGSFDFIKHKNVDWLIETHSLELEEGVSQLLKQSGYTVTIIKNAWWRRFIPEKRPLDHNRWLFASRISH